MRIVAGTARGRTLETVEGVDVRPTMDRVREAVFNSLNSLGELEGNTFLDLYAGSGALGLEALSRGADAVTFVDSDRRAVSTIAANLEALELEEGATVRCGDATRLLPTLGHHDVALLDPPYEFEAWEQVLAAVDADIVVVESDRAVDPGGAWEILKQKQYGGTVVVIARRSGGSSKAQGFETPARQEAKTP